MIITRITAGMGNQMFMYVAGLSLSKRLNTQLKLDITGFCSKNFNKYALRSFPNITEQSASVREIYQLAPFMAIADYFHVRGNSIFKHPFRRLLYEFMSRVGLIESGRAERRQRKPGSVLAPVPLSRLYFPQDFSYPEEFVNIQDNTYISGYWESEKFLADIAGLVRKKFTFSHDCLNPVLTERVQTCNSFAVHVRLGDKADADASYSSRVMHFLKNALNKAEELADKPSFFIFSDNIAWCRENLRILHDAEYTFIEGQTPPQDMALITQCRNVITSMSTFSWWGAWLNNNPQKLVITPEVKLWYPDAKDRNDLLPSEWLKLG